MDFAGRDLSLKAAIRSYFEVLYSCDLDRFDTLFHPACILFTISDGVETILDVPTYREILSKRLSPQSQNQPRLEDMLEVIHLAADIALVSLRVRVGDKVFRDHLHFAHGANGWTVVNKTYTLERMVGDAPQTT